MLNTLNKNNNFEIEINSGVFFPSVLCDVNGHFQNVEGFFKWLTDGLAIFEELILR